MNAMRCLVARCSLLWRAGWCVVPLLGGCHEPEPAYRAEFLAFDQRLSGTWTVRTDEAKDLTVEVAFAPRTLEVEAGRVKPEPLGDDRPAPATGAPNAFVATITSEGKGESGARERAEIELKGFVLSVEGEGFLAFQPSVRQMDAAHLGGLVVPIQQVVRFRLEGDVITVWAPKIPFGWLPDVAWLDRPTAPVAGEPDLGDTGEGPRRVTTDVDRFVDILRKYAREETFWQDPATLSRKK